MTEEQFVMAPIGSSRQLQAEVQIEDVEAQVIWEGKNRTGIFPWN